jgi:hypothetical protein
MNHLVRYPPDAAGRMAESFRFPEIAPLAFSLPLPGTVEENAHGE